MQKLVGKLVGRNIINQLNVENIPAPSKQYGPLFYVDWYFKKILGAGKTSRRRIIVYKNLILTKKMIFKDSFFPAVVSHTNYIKGKVFFLLFSLFNFH